MTSSATYRFGGFALDAARGALTGPDGVETALRPKTAEMLCLLAENAGRLVSRETLMHTVWPDVFVTDDSVTQCVTEIRRALGDEGARLLRTMPKRGYLLAADAHAGAAPPLVPDAAAPLPPDRASLVVLPFTNLGNDPEQDYFAAGITEELTTALARVRWFDVIALNAASACRTRAADVRQVGRELGARYVLEGSVRRADGRLRIAGQLLEAETGRYIWAERFEGGAEDVFALQDAIAEAAAGAIEPMLERAEIERVRTRPADSLGAYDVYLRSLPLRLETTREGSEAALALLRQALTLDPGFAPAKGNALGCINQRVAQGWDATGEREEGARLARETFAAHGNDPLTLTYVSHSLALLAFDIDGAFEAAMRAVALNPNSPWAPNAAGWANNRVGAPDVAIPHFLRAIRLSPHDVDVGYVFAGLGHAYLMVGQPAEALAAGEKALRQVPVMTAGHRVVIPALAWLGRQEEAALAARRFRQMVPTARADPGLRRLYRDHAFVERLIRTCREAGLPD